MRKLWLGVAVLVLLTEPAWAGFEEGVAAFNRGDYVAARAEWMQPADAGDSDAQARLAHLFAKGLGAERDLVRSYKWYSLAALGSDSADFRSAVLGDRNDMAREMSYEQIVMGEALVAAWIETNSTTVKAAAFIEDLLKHLIDDDKQVRQEAAAALSKQGPAASAAIPALENALRSEPYWMIRSWYAGTLARIGTAAVPALVRVMTDERAQRDEGGFNCLLAADALRMMGPAAQGAVPSLVSILQSDFVGLGAAYDAEMFRIAPAQIHLRVISTLESIGPAAAQAVPAMVAFLKTVEDPIVQVLSAGSILRIDPRSLDAADVLLELLAHHDPNIRAGAANVLAIAKPSTVDVVPALKKLRGDGSLAVRDAAEQALKALAPLQPLN